MPTRALTPLEIPYVVTNTTSSGSFVVRGPVDGGRLAAAYAALRREYPVLAGRIATTAFGFDLVAPDEPFGAAVAPITVERRHFAPADVRLGLDPEAGVSAVQLISDGLLHRVTLGVNHAVADGAHALFLNLRLWELYTDPEAETAPARALPASPLDLADRAPVPAGATPAHDTVVVESAGVVPAADAVDGGAFGFDRIRLDVRATEGLRARAKAAGLRLHGLLAGLIVVAERAELPGPADRAAHMAVFSPVDLRGRCDPPVAAAEVTNFAGSTTAPLAVRSDTSAEEIGHAVLDRLRADLRDGTVAAALTGTAGVQVTGGAPVRLSNIGEIPRPVLPEGLTAVDFHTSSEVDIDRIRPLVRTAPPEALAPLVGLHYHALTFDGRLSIELRHAPGTLPADAVRRIRDRIEAALTAPVGAAA